MQGAEPLAGEPRQTRNQRSDQPGKIGVRKKGAAFSSYSLFRHSRLCLVGAKAQELGEGYRSREARICSPRRSGLLNLQQQSGGSLLPAVGRRLPGEGGAPDVTLCVISYGGIC